jgi:uncharacterized membrane protein YcaP (DUF421 family)
MLFDSWTPILRTLLVGVLAYAASVLSLHASCKRTLSKMNAFDGMVTVALGWALANTHFVQHIALAQGHAIGVRYGNPWRST